MGFADWVLLHLNSVCWIPRGSCALWLWLWYEPVCRRVYRAFGHTVPCCTQAQGRPPAVCLQCLQSVRVMTVCASYDSLCELLQCQLVIVLGPRPLSVTHTHTYTHTHTHTCAFTLAGGCLNIGSANAVIANCSLSYEPQDFYCEANKLMETEGPATALLTGNKVRYRALFVISSRLCNHYYHRNQ